MTYLLDTHIWLWMLSDPARLGAARRVIDDRSVRLLLSVASAWELAIKVGRGRLTLPEPIDRFVPDRMTRTGVEALPVRLTHALRVGLLPNHHRDPFDRMLIAQAQIEQMPIITADAAFAAYDCELLMVD